MKRFNLTVIVLSIFVGLIFFLHNLIPYFSAHQQGLLFTPFNGGDENLYAAQIKAFMENRGFNSGYSPFLPWLGPWLLSYIGKFFHSVAAVFLLGDFIFPALLFFLFCHLSFLITQHRLISVLAGLFPLFLTPLLTNFPPVSLDLLQKFISKLTLQTPYFFPFNRLLPPQFTFIIFFLVIIYLYRSSIWSGIFAGALAYIYFYHWSAAVLIIFFNWLLIRSRKLFFSLLAALLISLPYLFQTLILPGLESQYRFGRIDGRFLEPLTTLRYFCFCLLIFFSPIAYKVKILLLSIFLAAVGLMNLQLLTGFTIAPGHWPSSTFEPLLAFSLLLIAFFWLKKINKINSPILFYFLIGVVLSYALINQLKISRQWQTMYQLPADEVKLYSYINAFLPPDSVVLSLDKRLNFYLPVLTQARPYLPYGSYSDLTNDQLWRRFNCAMMLSGLAPAEKAVKLQDTQMIGHLFDLTYNYELTPLSFGRRYLPENLINESLNRSDWLCPFTLDYVILNDSRLIGQTGYQPVFNNQRFYIYKVL